MQPSTHPASNAGHLERSRQSPDGDGSHRGSDTDRRRLDRTRVAGYARVIAVWTVAGPAVPVGVLAAVLLVAPALGAILVPTVALVAWIGLAMLTGPNGRAKLNGETTAHRRHRLALFAAGVAVGATALVVATA